MGGTAAGLEGVVAADSEICFIDGAAGILSYRGYNIHALADNATFEEVIHLLWHGELPNREQLDRLKNVLVQNRRIPEQVENFLREARGANSMDVLRTGVSMLGVHDPDAGDNSEDANLRKAERLMARTATIATTFARLRAGEQPLAGSAELGFAENFLYTLTGQRPDPVMARAFDIALILHADHEFNASTFAARVTAATLSDMYSAVTSAIGTLKGPLHGGANQEVIRLLLEAGTTEEALKIVRDRLGLKVKVPGFGHRVYRTGDPRATHLRALSEELGRRTGHEQLFEASREIERMVKESKNLNANVDFYSATTYYSLGIPQDMFTPVFAVSRMSGWTAHVMEQYRHNRLIRPRAEYKGPPDGRPWVPIERR